jgi:hypothetical protein
MGLGGGRAVAGGVIGVNGWWLGSRHEGEPAGRGWGLRWDEMHHEVQRLCRCRVRCLPLLALPYYLSAPTYFTCIFSPIGILQVPQ